MENFVDGLCSEVNPQEDLFPACYSLGRVDAYFFDEGTASGGSLPNGLS